MNIRSSDVAVDFMDPERDRDAFVRLYATRIPADDQVHPDVLLHWAKTGDCAARSAAGLRAVMPKPCHVFLVARRDEAVVGLMTAAFVAAASLVFVPYLAVERACDAGARLVQSLQALATQSGHPWKWAVFESSDAAREGSARRRLFGRYARALGLSLVAPAFQYVIPPIVAGGEERRGDLMLMPLGPQLHRATLERDELVGIVRGIYEGIYLPALQDSISLYASTIPSALKRLASELPAAVELR